MKNTFYFNPQTNSKKKDHLFFFVKGICLLVLFSVLISSCDVVKRKYMRGFYVSKRNSSSKTDVAKNIQSEKQESVVLYKQETKPEQNIIEQKKDSFFTEEKHQQKIAHRKKLSKIIPAQLKQLETKKEISSASQNKIIRKTKFTLRSIPHGCHFTPAESFFLGVIIVLAAIFCLAVPPVLISFWPDKPTFWIIAGIWITWAIGVIFILFTFSTFWTIFFSILIWNICALIAGGFIFDYF